MRLYTGLIGNSAGGSAKANRRESIAYDKYLDLLALFYNNGQVYDRRGNVVMSGQIKISYDGQSWYGWFSSFEVTDSFESPYTLALSADFVIYRETGVLRTTQFQSLDPSGSYPSSTQSSTSTLPLFINEE
jgi:hypothetical protein